ncbi:translation initiation/elongation factor MRX8 SCDLUD_004560 [Saccharomycodes ludwigii]|uniref:translation initiation/elongation factor MRX8 n=1 Tax=Saccharomycodes ludwigii TaxID=36035 RepID=UPI001E833354|nr:hypothetical protein SCDLUD_004560 [Saccharomycodes ludwigii]KAH3899134.1 hypothetical protein SCDLUD_004560 [Saccharomycodes ludwigii]
MKPTSLQSFKLTIKPLNPPKSIAEIRSIILNTPNIKGKETGLSVNHEIKSKSIIDTKNKNIKLKSKLNTLQKKNSNITKHFFNDIYEKFNAMYMAPTVVELNKVNSFFNNCGVQFEWSAPKYSDIPLKPTPRLKPLSLHLPEVAFLGRCNSGKSTLLNNLVTRASVKRDLNPLARASKIAGYTKTINSFNIENKLKIIDTPGYGVKGTKEQGIATMEYLQKRKNLKRTYILIPIDSGFTIYDSQIINFLGENGIPFEIIFTKMDKLFKLYGQNLDSDNNTQVIAKLNDIIVNSEVDKLPTLPQLLFVNSVINKKIDKRYGIDKIRYSILQACGII